MALDSYLFEKACYVVDGLAGVAEELHLLPADSIASREIVAYVNVALREGLMACCTITGVSFNGNWVVVISRE